MKYAYWTDPDSSNQNEYKCWYVYEKDDTEDPSNIPYATLYEMYPEGSSVDIYPLLAQHVVETIEIYLAKL